MAKKVGRNDPCPCGSGKKYKKCCLPNIRRTHWTLEEIRLFSTPEIIARLRGFGIQITEEDFLRDVRRFYGALDLAKHWHDIFHVNATGFNCDFPWMAAMVLWERLAPEVVSTEKLDQMMQEGYNLYLEQKVTEACRVWLEVWQHLKERFTPDMKSIRDAERVFSGRQSLFNWCQDLEDALHGAAMKDPSFHHERLEYCRDFCSLFPESDGLIMENMKRAEAESYFALGMVERGEQAFRDLAKEFPDSAWVYIGWGDMYWPIWVSRAPHDYDKAERLYRMAWERNPDCREEVLERLRELEEARRREAREQGEMSPEVISRAACDALPAGNGPSHQNCRENVASEIPG